MHHKRKAMGSTGNAPGRAKRLWPHGAVLLVVLLTAVVAGVYSHYSGDTAEADWSPGSQTKPAVVDANAGEAALVERASRAPLDLLKDAVSLYDASIRDYEGIFAQQAIFKGKLEKLSISRFRFRQSPFSVAMHVTEGADRADRMLYVEGKNDGKLLVHPTGFLGKLTRCIAVDPGGCEVREGSPRSITEFGFRNMLTQSLERFTKASRQGSLQMKCLGIGELGGRRILALRGGDSGGHLLIELEIERLLPVRIREYGADGRMVGLFWFKEFRINCGFGDSDFTKKSIGLSK